MQIMSNGRRRRTADEWRDILKRFAGSGVGQREFCRRHGLNLTSFQRWHKRLGDSAPGGFVELTPPHASPSPWALEIELASGTILRLRG